MWQDIKRIVTENKGKATGSFFGLLFGLFYIWLGFFKATFIILCIGIGYFIGKRIDDDKDFTKTIKKLLGPKDF